MKPHPRILGAINQSAPWVNGALRCVLVLAGIELWRAGFPALGVLCGWSALMLSLASVHASLCRAQEQREIRKIAASFNAHLDQIQARARDEGGGAL